MIDIALENTAKGYDINVVNGDVDNLDSFKTAIEVSLFSDGRADETQVFLPQARRGWVGDITSPIDGQNYGSLLWLVMQERLTQTVLNRAVEFARQSLQWLIDQNQASFVEVSGQIIPTEGISLSIKITSILGVVESHYVNLWENTVNAD